MTYDKEDIVFVLRQLLRLANADRFSFNEQEMQIFLKPARTILVQARERGDFEDFEKERFCYIDAVIATEKSLHQVDANRAGLIAAALLKSLLI